MPTLIYTIVIAFLFSGIKPPPTRDPWVETVASIEHTIIPVICGSLGTNGTFRVEDVEGTGFFVDDHGRFVTANHVLKGLDIFKQTHAGCNPAIYVPNDEGGSFHKTINFQYFWFNRCARAEAADIAICECIENPFTSPRIKKGTIHEVVLDPTELPDGQPIAFTGFPLQHTSPITSIGHIAGRVAMDPSPWFYYAIDKASWPGASGSPVYMQNGKVVGIVLIGGRDLGSGIGFAETSAAIADVISKASEWNAQKEQ